MNHPVQPIETFYRGYRFRSRLEARWGVFFDALGVAWVYEPEGFVLPSGTYYLPDFYLPEQGFWFDVKPRYCSQAEQESTYAKLCELSRPLSDRGFVLCGEPYAEKDPVYHNLELAYEIIGFDEPLHFAECITCHQIGITYCGWTGYVKCQCPPYWERPYSHKVRGGNHPRLMNAYATARAARFEYGETPKIYNPKFSA